MKNSYKDKIIILCMFIIIFSFIIYPQGKKINWELLGKSWNKFLKCPSDKNLKIVYKTIPNSIAFYKDQILFYKEINGHEYILEKIWYNTDLLKKKIYSGNHEAVKVAFKLFALAESRSSLYFLCGTLGEFIKINPKMFLEELKNHSNIIPDVILGDLIGSYGVEYIEEYKASLKETNKRINALKKVHEGNLKGIKIKCLKILEELKEAFKGAIEDKKNV